MDEDESEIKQMLSDLEFLKSEVFQELDTFMTLPRNVRTLKSGNLDQLLLRFGQFVVWIHHDEGKTTGDEHATRS